MVCPRSEVWMSLLLDAAYLAGATVASPYFVYKALTSEKYRTGFRERLGGIEPRTSDRACTWLHAVSLGEMNLVRPLVAGLAERWPDRELVLSTATNTGHDAARKHYPDRRVVYFPLDFSWVVRKAIRRIRPDLILLAELELWPNFLAAAQRAEVPVAIVNGRLSDRSFPRYRLIRPLVARWLRRLALCCVQNQTYADRLVALGAPPARVRVTGNLKFDACPEAPDASPAPAFAAGFGLRPDQPLIVGGCTWPGEDEALLAAYPRLKAQRPGLRLLLAPRQAERVGPVEGLIRDAGLPCVRRTALQADPAAATAVAEPVILLDTVGELARVYALATAVFVGGSLHPHGGHNILEPSGLSKPVLFGPHTENFRDITDELLAGDAARCVRSPAELEAALGRLLADPAAAAALGRRARQVVDRNRGATRRTLEALEGLQRPQPPTGSQAQ